MSQRHSARPWVDARSLAGLPRRRPDSLPPKREIRAIYDLRRLHPPIYLTAEDERIFLEGSVLTQEKCLRWLAILKQFFAEQPTFLSETVPLRTLPPISFLNLLTDWIDVNAKIEGRRKTKRPTWRWDALHGFVHQNRRLQSRKLLRNISRFAKSVAAHFDDPLFLLWGDYLQHSRPETSSCNEPRTTEQRRKAAKVFDMLRRVVVNKCAVLVEDYRTLKPYLSEEFREPTFARYLPDDRERESLDKFVARAAALDVYVQYLRMGRRVGFDQGYVEDMTKWLLKLGEPEARSRIEVIHGHFCVHPTVNLRRRPKKSVLRSQVA
jgi:hypothetical protein